METKSTLAVMMDTAVAAAEDNNNGNELQSQTSTEGYSAALNCADSRKVSQRPNSSTQLSSFLRHINCSGGCGDDSIAPSLSFLQNSSDSTTTISQGSKSSNLFGSGGNNNIIHSGRLKMTAEDSNSNSTTSPRSATADACDSANVSGLFEPVKCDDCKKEFRDPNMFLVHHCKKTVVDTTSTELETLSSSEDVKIPKTRDNLNSSAYKNIQDDAASLCSSLSDVETFTGKIVYNPDGSAYIIEPIDSELSDADSALDLPRQEGSIVDGRGMTPPDAKAIPQIVNAFHVSRNPVLYNAAYQAYNSNVLHEKKKVPEAPIMHSYRVFNVRNKKAEDEADEVDQRSRQQKASSFPIAALPSVPIKPILMCFVCKLSFGYAKSFVSHAMSEHNLTLIERERELLSEKKNTSAIIQVVGRSKEALLSFLEPVIPDALKAQNLSTTNVQGHFVTQPVNSSCSSSSVSTTTSMASLLNSAIASGAVATPSSAASAGLASIATSTSAGPAAAASTTSSVVNYIPDVPGVKSVSVPVSSPDKHTTSSSRSDVNSCSPVPEEESSSFVVPSYDNLDFRKSPIVSSDSNHVNKTVLEQQLRSACSSSILPLSSSSSSNNNSNLAPTFLHSITPSTTSATTSAFSFSGNNGSNPVCSQHADGKADGVECPKCDLNLGSSRSLGGHMTMMHSRNSCKTLKCPKCNWHYKYQETLEIHMKEKHPDSETSCVYCITSQAHPRLARGETYTCGYKPYRCDVCNYSTTTKGNLSIHMQSDKHLNNMQELQNGNVTNETLMQSQGLNSVASSTAGTTVSSGPISPGMNDMKKSNKPKPTWRCDVCNYETNVARNLRIHMTSEKHTHNMMVLQQNVKHMQQLTALQQAHQMGADPAAMLQFNPALAAHPEAALADLAYNQALMFMLGQHQQQQQHHQQQLANHQEAGMEEMGEPGEDQPDQNDSSIDETFHKMFLCAVCGIFATDSIAELNAHIQLDRTTTRENEVLLAIAGNYICKLCSYKTNLKANFQLHCKTDKHLQKLQYINHIKEGGPQNEWRLKYTSMNNPVQVKCSVCDYFTNSIHKLQLHATSPRHESSSKLFFHLRASEISIKSESKCYYCSICQYSSRSRAHLLQHVRSVKHLRNENLHQLQCHSQGIRPGGDEDIASIFTVKELTEDAKSDPEADAKDDEAMDVDKDEDVSDDTTKDDKAASMLKQALLDPAKTPDNCTADGGPDQNVASRHSSSPSPRMLCPLCQDQFSEKPTLEKHLMQIHNVTKEGVNTLLLMVDLSSSSSANQNASSPASAEDPQESRMDTTDSDYIKLDDIDSKKIDDVAEEVFKCQMCPRIFKVFEELCTHQNENGHLELKQTSHGPRYLCWKKGCNQYFKTAQSLQIHFREIHAKKQPVAAVSERHVYKYRCNQCSLAFKTMEKLQLHSQYHTIRAATKCPICARSFRSVPALQKHLETHNDLTEEDLEQYRVGLANNPLLNSSNQSMDSGSESIVDVKKENEGNMYEEDLDQPPLSINETKEFNETGASAADSPDGNNQQSFEDYLNTQALAEDSYNDPSRKYKCHRCKVAFTRQSYLTSHNKTLLHRKGDKLSYPMEKYLDPSRPYKCDTCKESFTQKNILLVHFNSVSHLHKLKKSMAESNANNNNGSPNAPNMASTNIDNNNTLSSINCNNSSESDKKPYKCNICKVAYSQGSTLDIHMRSVLHQTRASKLQELAMTGQVDLTVPLIEQPEPQKMQEQSKKLAADILSEAPTLTPNEPLPVPSTASSVQVPITTPLQSSNSTAESPSCVPNSPASLPPQLSPQQGTQIFTCQRCNSIFTSQEALLTHQHLYCFFSQPNNNANAQQATDLAALQTQQLKMPKYAFSRTKPSLYKHLLESYGFDVVMQFNEYYQRRPKKDAEKVEKVEKTTEEKAPEEKPEDAIKKEVPNDETAEKPSESKIDMPEINKSTCIVCSKVFSSVWVLKSHMEEIHKQVVPFDLVEKVSENFKTDYDKKYQNQTPECASPPVESTTPSQQPEAVINAMPENMSPAASMASGMMGLDALTNNQIAAQMQFNPLLMSMGLGLGLPMGMNPFAAAMNMHHPLLPFMMPPTVDPMAASGQPVMPNSVDSNFVMNQQKLMQQHQQQQQQLAAAQTQQQQQQGKRARTRISDDQLKILKSHFDINNSPTEEQINQMSEQSGLPQKVIKHWFRNTLFKERQRNKDSPYNFNNPPSTMLNLEEYEKTGETKTVPLENVDSNTSKTGPSSNKEDRGRENMESPVESCSGSEGRKSPIETPEFIKSEEKPAQKPNATSEVPKSSASSISSPVISTPKTPMYSFASSMIPGDLSSKQSVLSLLNPSLSMAAALPSPIASSFNPHMSLSMSTSPPMSTTPTPPLSINALTPGSTGSQTPSTPGSREHGKRANRTRFTDYQIKVLQEFFDQNAYPKDDDLEYLSKLLNLSPRVIVVWFQNARQKARKVYENQPPVEPEDDGTGRFQRTPGLNYQCKKCLLVFQRYYELIKHQKSHCFKEEEKQKASPSHPDVKPEVSRSGTSTPAEVSNEPPTSEPGLVDSKSGVFRCDKCNLVFQRFELWREHQIIHIMNPNLFPTYPPNTPFGMLQYEAQQAGQMGQMPLKRKLSESLGDGTESEENQEQPRDKRLRTTILPEQLDYLYQKYQIESNPSRKMLENIAREVGLKKRVVQVWFQNTRARERKGQFRAHQQVIHKRCPFCRALFKAKSALESHLATKHPDQYTKGDINIDSLPDGDMDSNPATPPASTASSGGSPPATAFGANIPSSMANMMPPMFPGGNAEAVQNTMKRYYEDSLKRYLDELSHNNDKIRNQDGSSGEGCTTSTGKTGDSPLDLSKPVRLGMDQAERSFYENALLGDTSSFLCTDDARSETYSESTDNMDIDDASNPTSPACGSNPQRPLSAGNSSSAGNKRYRTQMTTLQLKVMKTIFSDYKTPTMAECELLGREIGLAKRVIQVWFQNARAKEKKAKLAFAKHFGHEVEVSRTPEECTLCNFKYTHKYSIQDHLFTRKHLDNIKSQIENVKKLNESSESSAMSQAGLANCKPDPTAVAQLLRESSEVGNGDGAGNAAAQAMAAVAAAAAVGGHGQPNLAQLQQMMSLQQMVAAGGLNLADMNPSTMMNPFGSVDPTASSKDGNSSSTNNNTIKPEEKSSNHDSDATSPVFNDQVSAALPSVTSSSSSTTTSTIVKHELQQKNTSDKDNVPPSSAAAAASGAGNAAMNPFGDLAPLMAGGSDAANLLPYMYAGFPGYYAGVPGTFIHPAMYAGKNTSS